ncbi:MAG: phage holin family protein [Armatimonadota bacterium]
MNFIIRWLGGVLAAWLTIQIGQALGIGLRWGGFVKALLFVLVLGIVNAVIRPIVKLFTLPLTCLTFGLFAFVLNALFFWIAAVLTGGVEVENFLAALFGSVVLSILSGIINSFVKLRPNRRD